MDILTADGKQLSIYFDSTWGYRQSQTQINTLPKQKTKNDKTVEAS